MFVLKYSTAGYVYLFIVQRIHAENMNKSSKIQLSML